jgi:large subunit ribosomal protein L16
MLQPKRRKFRKDFRGRRCGLSYRGSSVSFGEYGLKAMEVAWLSSNVIEAGRRAITHYIKRGGRVWVRVFPDKPVTARPAGQRMGGGKGDIDRYVAVVKPGKILFEVAGLPEDVVKTAFARASAKMPFATKVVSREEAN